MKNTLQPITLDYSNLVGVAYEKMNCWDIAVEFYQKIFGIKLHHMYQGPTPENPQDTKNIIYSSIGDFERVEEPSLGDIILFKIKGIEGHMAIYLGFGKMLHSTKKTGSIIDRVKFWEKMIVGYYRIKRHDDKN